jgi:hypothetical protein
LLVLALLGIGLASPLLLALVNRWKTHGAVETARQFLLDLQTGRNDGVAKLLTPRARGEENEQADGEAPSAIAMQNAGRITQMLSTFLQQYEFTLESPSPQGEFLAVPFILHSRVTGKAPRSDATPGTTTSATRPPPAADTKSNEKRRGIMHLRQIGERWRVAGLSLPPLSPSKLDFEQVATNQLIAPTRAQTPFDALGPVSLADFSSAWQMDVDIENQPAETVLLALAREIGRPVRSPFDGFPGMVRRDPRLARESPTLPQPIKQALQRPVTLHLHKVSRFGAIEGICRLVGLHPVYEANSLLLQPGPRRLPAAACGPFLLEATFVSETPDEATGTLALNLHVMPMPAKLAALSQVLPLHVSNLQIIGAAGEDHFHRRRSIFSPQGSGAILRQNHSGTFDVALDHSKTSMTWNLPLKNLLRDVDRIALVRCSIGLNLIRAAQQLHLEPVVEGSYAGDSDVRIVLRKIEPGPIERGPPEIPPGIGSSSSGYHYRFRAEGLAGRLLCWQAYPRRTTGNPQFGKAYPTSQGDFSRSPTIAPESFDFKVLSPGEELTWDCQLHDIPLSRPLRRLAPLRYEGHSAPVSVEVEPLRGERVWLRITNHSQKRIDAVVLKLAYLDAQGRSLAERVRTMPRDSQERRNTLPFTPPPTALAASEEWRLSEQQPPPKEARSVRATLLRIDFADATSWQP